MTKRAKLKARRKKTLKRATQYSLLGLAIGAGVGTSLFMMVVSVTPTISSKQIADAVRSQAVRGSAINPAARASNPPLASAAAFTNTIPPSTDQQQFFPVSFEQLAGFRFIITDQILDPTKDPRAASTRTIEQIPFTIKALDDRGVSVKGYMLPMKFNGPLATDFLLMRNQSMCCYGLAPNITEWVNVHMAGKGIKPIVDQPITVSGTFHVGEVRENGDLVGIYQLDGQKLTRN
jgi:hypothetical protein